MQSFILGIGTVSYGFHICGKPRMLSAFILSYMAVLYKFILDYDTAFCGMLILSGCDLQNRPSCFTLILMQIFGCYTESFLLAKQNVKFFKRCPLLLV